MSHEDAAAWVRRFLDALERFDAESVSAFLSDEVTHVEYPNALLPKGLTRDKAAMLNSLHSGRKNLTRQTYQLGSVVADGDFIAFEAAWEGELAQSVGGTAAGSVMKANFGVFLRLKNGKVTSWHNYDCFEPF